MQQGCDSVHTLNLTINNSNTGTSSATACDSYTWDGVVYTTSGAYTNTYTNAAGCDSVHTLNLTINSSNTGSSSVPHVIVIFGMELHIQQVEHIPIHIPMQQVVIVYIPLT